MSVQCIKCESVAEYDGRVRFTWHSVPVCAECFFEGGDDE